ncbi:YbaK/EbsC family protein [Patescibacteria group bacterium]|nr:YbaK/EbsC family protein [Patescibacteria group bacterium]
MKIPSKITNFLTKNKVPYEVALHRTVYTAYDLAQTMKKEMDKVLKTLVVKADKSYILVVVPASFRLDLSALKKMLKAKAVKIEKEQIMPKLFKIKAGAISPFYGPLHKMPVYVDKAVLKTQKALVQAGSFEESLHLKSRDLIKVVEGVVGNFAKKHYFAKVKKAKNKTTSKKPKIKKVVKSKKTKK